jgi:hypothetical protein
VKIGGVGEFVTNSGGYGGCYGGGGGCYGGEILLGWLEVVMEVVRDEVGVCYGGHDLEKKEGKKKIDFFVALVYLWKK